MSDSILDHQEEVKPRPPSIWPTTIASGIVGAAILIVFQGLIGATTARTQSIITLLLVLIVLNSSLNFYRYRKFALKGLQTAVIICFATFVIMYLLQALYALVWGLNFYVGYRIGAVVYSPLYVFIVGFLVSAVTAVLSSRG